MDFSPDYLNSPPTSSAEGANSTDLGLDLHSLSGDLELALMGAPSPRSQPTNAPPSGNESQQPPRQIDALETSQAPMATIRSAAADSFLGWQPFNPEEKTTEDAFVFKAPPNVANYCARYFQAPLKKETRDTMRKKHPHPDTLVVPKMDKWVHHQRTKSDPKDAHFDKILTQLQHGLLAATGPLTSMWADLEGSSTRSPNQMVPVNQVLDMIQRSLVLTGNVFAQATDARRRATLMSIHPTWAEYAQEIPASTGCLPATLLGDDFKEKILHLVENDTAVAKAKRICRRSEGGERNIRRHPDPNRPPRVFQSNRFGLGSSTSRSNDQFFRRGGPSWHRGEGHRWSAHKSKNFPPRQGSGSRPGPPTRPPDNQ